MLGISPDSDGLSLSVALIASTEPAYLDHGSEQDAALEAELAKRAAASTPPAKADKGDSVPPATDDKSGGQAAGEVSKAVAVADDKGGKPPEAPGGLDLSFIPDEVRADIHVKSEKAAAALKSGFMAHSAATKKFIEASELRKEAEAIQRDADNYRALTEDPDVAAVVVKAVADKRAGVKPAVPVAVAADPDLSEVDPKIVQAFTKIAETAATRAANAKAAEVQAELQRPATLRAVMNKAFDEYASAHSVEPDVMNAAVAAADAALGAEGGTWNPKMVSVLIGPQVEIARLKKHAPPVAAVNKAAAPANGSSGTAEVASPVGRGGTHSDQTVPFPKHYVNGAPPRRQLTSAEWKDQDEYQIRLAYGPNATIEDYAGASRIK